MPILLLSINLTPQVKYVEFQKFRNDVFNTIVDIFFSIFCKCHSLFIQTKNRSNPIVLHFWAGWDTTIHFDRLVRGHRIGEYYKYIHLERGIYTAGGRRSLLVIHEYNSDNFENKKDAIANFTRRPKHTRCQWKLNAGTGEAFSKAATSWLFKCNVRFANCGLGYEPSESSPTSN